MIPINTKDISELTKSQIKIVCKDIVDRISETGNAIESMEMISKMENFVKELRSNKELIEMVRDEVSKYGSKGLVTASGVKIELAEVGVKYDYSQCNDYEYSCLLEQKLFLDEKLKERENFLKMLPKSGTSIITELGEVIMVYPPSKSSTSSIKTTISK